MGITFQKKSKRSLRSRCPQLRWRFCQPDRSGDTGHNMASRDTGRLLAQARNAARLTMVRVDARLGREPSKALDAVESFQEARRILQQAARECDTPRE